VRTLKLNWLFTALLLTLTAFSANAQVGRNVDEYNKAAIIPTGVKGYDPVSFFAEGGSAPQKGNPSITLNYEGVTYSFVSESNKEVFEMMPEKYEPTYGQYCAWAMAKGSKIDINVNHFIIDGNRIHFFVNSRAKRNFERRDGGIADNAKRADVNWKRFSGEEPRL
jgi:YHS domain-containing protein